MAIDLKTLNKSKQHPPIIVLHGHEGVGKSTCANGFPGAFWLNLEDSTYAFSPEMVQVPRTYEEIIDLLDSLIEQDHGYKTIIVDTLDKLEILMTASVCSRNKWSNISEPAFGKGYAARSEEFRAFWDRVQRLNKQKNMLVVLIAHSQVVKVQDPILPEYDRHAIQLYKTENAFIRREADLVGYCLIESFTSTDGQRNLATTAGERQIRTHPNPAYDAKTRVPNMPEYLPMDARAIMNCYSTKKTPTPPKEEN